MIYLGLFQRIFFTWLPPQILIPFINVNVTTNANILFEKKLWYHEFFSHWFNFYEYFDFTRVVRRVQSKITYKTLNISDHQMIYYSGLANLLWRIFQYHMVCNLLCIVSIAKLEKKFKDIERQNLIQNTL